MSKMHKQVDVTLDMAKLELAGRTVRLNLAKRHMLETPENIRAMRKTCNAKNWHYESIACTLMLMKYTGA